MFVGLGSNILAEQNIQIAINGLRDYFPDVQFSDVYRSPAVGFEGEDFLNLVASFETDLTLEEVLAIADELEQRAGRTRLQRGRFDSRTLDVDVLLYGQLRGEHRGREWPNPDLLEFAHVLLPMSELAGELQHPVVGKSYLQLWGEFGQLNSKLSRVELPEQQ